MIGEEGVAFDERLGPWEKLGSGLFMLPENCGGVVGNGTDWFPVDMRPLLKLKSLGLGEIPGLCAGNWPPNTPAMLFL